MGRRIWDKSGENLTNEIREKANISDEIYAWCIGQCGYIFKYHGFITYIDPVLTDLVDSQGRSEMMYSPAFDSRSANVDLILITHEHKDHLCDETIVGLVEANPNVKFICPGNCAKRLDNLGIESNNIIIAKEHSKIRVKSMPGINIRAISTAHPIHQLDEAGQEISVGYEISFGQTKVLHLGDTYLTDRLVDSIRELGAPNVLLAPINGMDDERGARGIIGNMNGYELAELVAKTNPVITIPTHFDMIKGNTVETTGFENAMKTVAKGHNFLIPELGELIVFGRD